VTINVDATPPDAGANATSAGDDGELRREGDRIAQLIDDLGALGGAPIRQRVEELVRRLVHLYGTGLGRLMQILGGDGRIDDDARARLRDDPLVASLLLLHGLHPDPHAAAAAYDPGPEPGAPPPGGAASASASGLVQIDLGRGRAAKAGGGP
jgi:hypothetical protein